MTENQSIFNTELYFFINRCIKEEHISENSFFSFKNLIFHETRVYYIMEIF